MSDPELQWWGVVDFHNHPAAEAERRFADVRTRVEEAEEVVVLASEPGNFTLRWPAGDRDDALRRIRELAGVEPEEFAPTHPQPV